MSLKREIIDTYYLYEDFFQKKTGRAIDSFEMSEIRDYFLKLLNSKNKHFENITHAEDTFLYLYTNRFIYYSIPLPTTLPHFSPLLHRILKRTLTLLIYHHGLRACVCVSLSPDFPEYSFDTISSQPSNPPIELLQSLREPPMS